MRGSRFCCGVPLDGAARIAGAFDIIIGAVMLILWSVQLIRAYDDLTDKGTCCKISYFIPFKVRRRTTLPVWVPITVISVCALQILLGLFLILASVVKSRWLCYLYVLGSGIITPFSGSLLCIYQMLVAGELLRELSGNVSRDAIIDAAGRRALFTQPTVVNQPHMKVPTPGPFFNSGKNGHNGIETAGGIQSGGNKPLTWSYHQHQQTQLQNVSGLSISSSRALNVRPSTSSLNQDSVPELPPPSYEVAVQSQHVK